MNTSNNTRNENETEFEKVSIIDAMLCVLACLLCVFVCTGNIMTILAIIHTPSLRTFANTYVASLAAADFVVGLTLILLALFLLPTTRVNLFYRSINLCVLMQGLNIGMTAISAIHMAIISIDRFLYISYPYIYQRKITLKFVISFVCFAWTFGIIYSLLPQVIHKPYGNTPVCDVTEVLPIGYLFYSTTVIYWTLVVVIVIMYSLILRTALKQRKAIHTTSIDGSRVRGKTSHLRKSTVRSVKFFLTVFGVFFICLTPILICMGVDFYVNVPADLYRFLNLLALTNSGMNFIIYGALNKEFRHAFFKLARMKSSGFSMDAPVYSTTNFTATNF